MDPSVYTRKCSFPMNFYKHKTKRAVRFSTFLQQMDGAGQEETVCKPTGPKAQSVSKSVGLTIQLLWSTWAVTILNTRWWPPIIKMHK